MTDRRQSRAGGNPDLYISEIFKDYCKSKLLDSRLRGNDGGEVFFGFLLSAFYRRILQAEASFRIIPLSSPSTIIGTFRRPLPTP